MRNWLQVHEDKRSTSGGYVLAALLAALGGGLGYAGHLAAEHEVDISAITAPEQQAPAKTAPAAVALPRTVERTAADLAETTARPLFFADRRPPGAPEAKAQAPQPQEAPPAPLTLVAIARIGDQSRILVRGGKEPGRWLGLGEEYHGWLLKDVARETAVVQARGHVAELQLFPTKAQPQPAEPTEE